MTERIINCRKRNAASMATRRTNPAYRMQKNERNAQAMATRRTNPAHRTRKMKGMLKLW